MDSALRSHCESLFGRAPAPGTQPADTSAEGEDDGEAGADTPDIPLNLSLRQERLLWRHVASIENFWETLDEIEPGAVARLARLTAECGWELIFLTKRPRTAGATAQVQSQRWLRAKGFPHPSVFVVQGSRGKIAESLALDVVVDDRPENCVDVIADSAARAFLICRSNDEPAAAARRLGIGTVRTVSECLDVLLDFDAKAREKPGMVT